MGLVVNIFIWNWPTLIHICNGLLYVSFNNSCISFAMVFLNGLFITFGKICYQHFADNQRMPYQINGLFIQTCSTLFWSKFKYLWANSLNCELKNTWNDICARINLYLIENKITSLFWDCRTEHLLTTHNMQNF